MAITATDIIFRLSTAAGAAGNTTAQGDPNASLGKYMSTTAISATALNNAFADLSGDDNAASAVHYRCIFVLNDHATLQWQSVVVWLSAEVANGADIAIATDNIGPVPKGQAGAQAEEEADEDTAPTSVSAFSSPTTKGTGLSLGNLDAGDCHAIWVRRTGQNSAALDDDGVTIRCEGDTAA